MDKRYFQHTLGNGLTLLCEKMPAMQSAAMTLLVPAGSATDPAERAGSATVLADLVLRGAGGRDNRALTDHLDSLGLQRSSYISVYHTRFGCAAVAANVMDGLAAYADIVRRPTLPADGFASARELAIQSLDALEDDPRQKLLIQLREWHFPSPLGRSSMGTRETLEKLDIDFAKTEFARHYHARGAILSLAGNIDFSAARGRVEELFGDWNGSVDAALELSAPLGRLHHQQHASEQTHIGIAYPSILETDPDYYSMRLGIEVLSGGMSGRLFTEVREKRGLVYNVWAGYSGLKGLGSIMGYAGTSTDRAQATLDCFVQELYRLTDGVTQDELDRAKTGVKAATIMQGESTSARAGAIAHDYFTRGRIRTLEELKAAIDEVTLDQVNDYLAKHPPGPFTVVTVGPKELKVPT